MVASHAKERLLMLLTIGSLAPSSPPVGGLSKGLKAAAPSSVPGGYRPSSLLG